MFEKQIVIDAKGHILGRLASYVAKELLNGQRIAVVRCEKICIAGSLFRNKVKFGEFLNKRMNHNPRRGYIHYRSPARVFWKSVRGMLPHKTPRGAAALGRLKVFVGIPLPYDTKQRKVVADALKIVRLKNDRPYCILGELCGGMGWTKSKTVDKLETKRINRSNRYHAIKKAQIIRTNTVQKTMEPLKKIKEELAKYGY